MMEPGILYVVATPIGNLEDITLRALRMLREADLIAAEDTRVTRKLLAHFDIHTPLTSYHAHTEARKEAGIVASVAAGKRVALVTDAGMPGISHPGSELIAACLEAGLPVVPVPGPSAALTALVISGLPTRRFAFEGFLPHAAGERRAHLETLRGEERTLIFYESPGRVVATLEAMQAAWGDRQAAAARELTKKFEEVVRGPMSALLEHFQEQRPQGEFVLVVAGATPGVAAPAAEPEVPPEEAVAAAVAAGSSERDAVRAVATARGLSRRVVYAAWLRRKQEEE
ncbi:MAG TPA: 16S rRNA (cytidine(1402)-2'-O)-methyltransferase [Armatimonadota bacterium]|nr:16S rRNA (cytidine(1402)-2'-O)-methyltransferase [Armatimonadota bacterium]